MGTEDEAPGLSRRRFIGSVGAGTAGLLVARGAEAAPSASGQVAAGETVQVTLRIDGGCSRGARAAKPAGRAPAVLSGTPTVPSRTRPGGAGRKNPAPPRPPPKERSLHSRSAHVVRTRRQHLVNDTMTLIDLDSGVAAGQSIAVVVPGERSAVVYYFTDAQLATEAYDRLRRLRRRPRFLLLPAPDALVASRPELRGTLGVREQSGGHACRTR